MVIVAGIITGLFSLSLIALLIVTLLKKETAVAFLSSFASSAKAHYIGQFYRLVVGLGLFIYADHMLFSGLFKIFGGALIASSLLLIILPWKWHNKLGKWAGPIVIKHIVIYAVSAFLLGLLILYCVIVPAL